VAFMFIGDSLLSRRDGNGSNTLNFTTEAEPVFFINTNWLILYKKMFVVNRENHTEDINTMCGQT
jgi:hypothetical protein